MVAYEIIQLHDFLLTKLQNQQMLGKLADRSYAKFGFFACDEDIAFYAFEYPIFKKNNKQGRIDLLMTLDDHEDTHGTMTIIFDLKTWGTDPFKTLCQLQEYAEAPMIQDNTCTWGPTEIGMRSGCGIARITLAVIGPSSERHKYEPFIHAYSETRQQLIYITWEELGWDHKFIHNTLYKIKHGEN